MYVLPLMNRASRNCNINSLQKNLGGEEISCGPLSNTLSASNLPTYLLFSLLQTLHFAHCERVWQLGFESFKLKIEKGVRIFLKLQNRLVLYKRASRGRILTLAGRENGPFSLTDYLSWHSFSSFLLSALPIFKSSKVHTGKNNRDFIVKLFQIDCCIIQEVQS